MTRAALREAKLEGYRQQAFNAWIQLSANREQGQEFPSFEVFVEQLGLLQDEDEQQAAAEKQAQQLPPTTDPKEIARRKFWTDRGLDPRPKEEIMAGAQAIADLDSKRKEKRRRLGLE